MLNAVYESMELRFTFILTEYSFWFSNKYFFFI